MSRYLLMATLVFAGEIIFGLPFHTARFFRPTLLEAFGFTNTELGDVFAVYGVTAMIAYFPGGMLADRFSARSLLTVSLATTGIGGFYMASLSLVEYLHGQRGQGGLNDLLRAMAETGSADAAFQQVYRRDVQALRRDWSARLRQQYGRL